MIDVPSESKGRAKHFGDKAHRQAVELKDKEVAMEFCNGLLGTSLSISLYSPSLFLVSLYRRLLPFNRFHKRNEGVQLMIRLQYSLGPTSIPLQTPNTINEILGRSTSNLRLSKTWNTRKGCNVCSRFRDC